MKRTKIHKAKEVFKIKNNIYKIAPYIKDVDVKLAKTYHGKYESLIRVHIPHKKKLFAAKKDECPKLSLEKSRQAIIKQIKKLKKKKLARRALSSSFEEIA
ncbi:MAG: ribosome-associated translation inhibitor RaiA [Bacteriovoracaceae bacterium]|jgi:hypothetical protein